MTPCCNILKLMSNCKGRWMLSAQLKSDMRKVLGVHWKDWCCSWNSNTLATWWEELTHLKRPWCWERLRAGEGDDRGWDGWMASPTQWIWVWVDSGSWWWTRRPGVLWFMGSQRVGHDWVTELNWTEVKWNNLKWTNLSIPKWTNYRLFSKWKMCQYNKWWKLLIISLTNAQLKHYTYLHILTNNSSNDLII